MTLKQHARNAIARGFNIFPCASGGTKPAAHFSEKVASSETDLTNHRWWSSDTATKNIGVRTGWSDNLDAYLIVVDVDVQHNGHQSLIDLLHEHEPLPDTYAVATPSGGCHFYFISEHDIRNSANKLGQGIDIRGHNGFVVAEGSIREQSEKKPAGVYSQVGTLTEIAWLPLWIEEKLLTDNVTTYGETVTHDEDIPEGERNNRLFKEAAGLRGKGASEKAILAFLTVRNNEFSKPLPAKDINVIAKSAASYSVNQESIYDKLSEKAATELAQTFDKTNPEEAQVTAPKEKEDAPPKEVKTPSTFTLDSLKLEELKPMRYCVQDLFAEGLYFLNGRPKAGKSWLIMEIAAAVSSGTHLWGEYETYKSPVLYLALEDGKRRLKSRMAFFPEAQDIHFAIDDVENIGEGFEEQMRLWMKEQPDTRLIVVDIFQRIKGEDNDKRTAYQADYTTIKPIQELALELHVCIIFVHHLRKAKTEAIMDSISGSNGIAGAADGLVFLQAADDGNSGKLSFSARDTDSGDYDLIRAEQPSGRWEYVGEHMEDGRKQNRTAVEILAYMSTVREASAADIAQHIRASRSHTSRTCGELFNEGKITFREEGRTKYYMLPEQALGNMTDDLDPTKEEPPE